MVSRSRRTALRCALAVALVACGGVTTDRSSANADAAPSAARPVTATAQDGDHAPPAAALGGEAADSRAHAELVAPLHPASGPAAVLIGLSKHMTGYGPLYDEGPKADPTPTYRTLLIRWDGAAAKLVGERPYLVVPQANGFRFIGDATVVVDETEAARRQLGAKKLEEAQAAGSAFWYAATSLWETTRPAGIERVRAQALAKARAHKKLGRMEGEQVRYVTRAAMCRISFWAEWTGGALAFHAGEAEELASFGTPISRLLEAHVGRAGLERFALDVVRIYDKDATEVDVTQPTDLVWRTIDWKKEAKVCLSREDGRVYTTGAVTAPNNSARTHVEERLLTLAPPSLAPSNPEGLSLESVRRAFDGAEDVLVAPNQSIAIVLTQTALVVIDVRARSRILEVPAAGYVVMAEWAGADALGRWEASLR